MPILAHTRRPVLLTVLVVALAATGLSVAARANGDKPAFPALASPILTALTDTPAERAAPDAEESRLRAELEEILKTPELEKVFVGVHVRSLTDGRTIFEHNGTKLFNPASNMKILTTASALWYLGPSYRFRTEARRDPKIQNGVVDGHLYIKGYGDPTLTTEELFGFVNEIALHGVTKVKGDLIVDDTFFDDVTEGPGWEQEHSDQAYAAPIGALAVDYGTFNVRVLPGPNAGDAASVFVWPPIDNIEVSSSVTTVAPKERGRVFVGTTKKDADHVRVTLRGTVTQGDLDGYSARRRVASPAIFAGEEIKHMLQLRGIEVKGKVKLGHMPRAGLVPVTMHYSRPLAEVTSTLNKYSNNFIAEQLLKTVAAEMLEPPGTWAKGVEVMRKLLVDLGVPDGSFVLANGSGLNDVNRVTPAQITRVLAAMYDRFEVMPEFTASLAVAGASGTIVGRFENTPAASKLRAKTGTLNGVSALSGYVPTQNGKVLAFSIVMNDYSGRARTMWHVQDKIGVALARYKSPEIVARP